MGSREAVAAAALVVLLLLGAVAAVGDGPATGGGGAEQRDPASAESDTEPVAAPVGGPFTLVWVGDMMIGSTTPSPRLPPDGAAGTFEDVADLLQADVVTGNLEGPITDQGPKSKCNGRDECYMFSQPPEYVDVYKAAGFDVLNLANNHSFDRGEEGRAQTMELLDGAGIAYVGLPDQVHRRNLNGTDVAFVGFSHYTGTNPITDHAAVASQVEALAAAHDAVVVFFHGGLEGDRGTHVSHTGDPGTDFIAFAHTAVDAGADLVLGSGAHVLRAMEIYNGRLIAYGLGNFATYGWFGLTKTTSTSGVLRVTVAPDGSFSAGTLSPTKLVGKGTPAKGGDAASMVTALSGKDFPDTGVRVAPDGTITAPSSSSA